MSVGSTLTRPRPDHPEILDDRATDPHLVRRSMRDVALSNRLFGGTRAVLQELAGQGARLPATATLLDVGTGLGDIPAAAARLAARNGTAFFTIGVDASPDLARASATRVDAVVVADAAALPFRDSSVDVVLCSQLLHHFAADTAAVVLQELNRVASRSVILGDIRRSRLAAAGLWLASFPLGFHSVSRHDGVASIRRGFTPDELRALVAHAIGRSPPVHRRLGFRLSTSWSVT